MLIKKPTGAIKDQTSCSVRSPLYADGVESEVHLRLFQIHQRCGSCSVKRELHVSEKGIDTGQPAYSSQAYLGRKNLLLDNFLNVNRPFYS